MFNDYYKYKACWCPICHQGAVVFVKEELTGLMYLYCDECEAEWENPEDINNSNKGTRFKHVEQIIEPSLKDIIDMGWEPYIMK